ncbi:MAG: histidine phosphatase family protein [Chloroflexi bacterium]|nr:histidine phosphatase family protein [Chloroflexota bacterium]MBP8056946.1 histidine phosphatase family protein [Chloroflexota bacterium]
MKTLLILRHAKSSWANVNQTDHERPLNGRGKKDAPQVGRVLKEKQITPDLIITSTAERALATAEAAAISSDYDHELKLDGRLYLAPVFTYLAVLRELGTGPACVMVVGHNPGSEDLVYHLTDEPELMPTAALACITLPLAHWSELDEKVKGKLVWSWRPHDE